MQQKSKVPWGYIVPALIILAVIIGVVYIETYNHSPAAYTLPPNGTQDYQTVLGPNFACLGSESLNIHLHPWLTITINGKNVTVPPGIGIQNPANVGTYDNYPVFGGGSNSCFEPVHTHDASGIIHIESPTNANYTLGEFFTEWSLAYQYAVVNGSHEPIVFNNTDILGYKVNGSSTSLKLIVDGKTAPAGDFQSSSTQYGNLVLNVLDYCSNSVASSPPCAETAPGDPAWNGVTGFAPTVAGGYPYGSGHTIVIEYTS